MRVTVTSEREARIRRVLSRRQPDLCLVMDNIWDPHNASAILRSCDAFGVLDVHLYYSREKYPDFGKKSSASALKWIRRHGHRDPDHLLAALAKEGLRPIRTGFSDKAVPVFEFDLTQPVAVILGNEHSGVSPELVEAVPDELYLPMRGMVRSFNVSVASALILYEAFRQREAKGMYDSSRLAPDEYEALVRDWCSR